MTYSVLLVEDDDRTRQRLTRLVDSHESLVVVSAVGTLEAARKALAEHSPDVLLTDLGLPDGDGIALIHEVQVAELKTEVMVISVFGDEQHVIAALEAGATGYLLKDGSAEYIGESVLQLLQGGSPISPAIARHLLKRFRQDSAKQKVSPDAPNLTERELEVLGYVAKGFTYAEIAEMLSVSFHTVTSHVKHIYRKLAVGSRGEAVFEAHQLGLIRMDD